MTANLPARDAKGRVLPGSSLNPKGRPRTGFALAEMIREVAGEPTTMRELVALVLDVAFGRPVALDGDYLNACAAARKAGLPLPPRPTQVECIQPSIAEMQRAWEFLATWGFQKPATALEISSGAEPPLLDYKKLSLEELAQLETTLRKAAGQDPPSGAGSR